MYIINSFLKGPKVIQRKVDFSTNDVRTIGCCLNVGCYNKNTIDWVALNSYFLQCWRLKVQVKMPSDLVSGEVLPPGCSTDTF